MKLSKLAQTIGDSPTLKLNAQAAALKKEGKPIIHLGGGEPVFPAPQAAIDAIIAKAKTRNLKYSPTTGSADLKAAIIAFTKKHYNKEVKPSEIIVSSGAKQCLYNFLLSVIDAGDEVLYPAPFWVSYPEMVRMAGGEPVEVTPSNGVLTSIEDINKAITPKTKAIIINSPCNPSGMMFDEGFIKGIVTLCEQKELFLVMDDIYNQLVFDGKTCPNPYEYAQNGQNLVTINGVSKLYGMTGLRIGWAVSENKDLIAAMGRMQAQSTSCNSDLSEAGAIGALTGDQSCIEDLRNLLEENRAVLLEELGKIPHIKLTKPNGTFYSFADFSYYEPDSDKLAAYLLDEVMVAVVPGKAFGLDGHQRISFCASKDSIIEGVRRIAHALEKKSQNKEVKGK